MFPVQFIPQVFSPSSPAERPEMEIPARVCTAIHMIEFFSAKAGKKIAVNDVGMDSFEGDELNIEERKLLLFSCNTVTDYLQGRLKPDRSDKLAMRRQRLSLEKSNNEKGTKILCPACGNNTLARMACDLCSRKGLVIVQPIAD